MTELKALLEKLHERYEKLGALIEDIEATIQKAEGQRKL